jgi:hypothetical protein
MDVCDTVTMACESQKRAGEIGGKRILPMPRPFH